MNWMNLTVYVFQRRGNQEMLWNESGDGKGEIKKKMQFPSQLTFSTWHFLLPFLELEQWQSTKTNFALPLECIWQNLGMVSVVTT
jgi:hypothetical protein